MTHCDDKGHSLESFTFQWKPVFTGGNNYKMYTGTTHVLSFRFQNRPGKAIKWMRPGCDRQ